jgi:hypothetical protein
LATDDDFYQPVTSKYSVQGVPQMPAAPTPVQTKDYRPHLGNIVLWLQINAIVLFFVFLLTAYVVFLHKPTFEYAILAPADTALEKELNKAGREGWEIVASRRAVDSKTDKGIYELIMKR